ncbi:hypothetical protein FOA43_001178 [Brettanomyces nanus]|uniref:Protein DOM34 homolog n=1 Tax=Eeniella nana TaxID=13502 RepID=A0A875RYY8_EENNA|nr:uncharacterized protein FOA43_001178 [Brettanomyces nanus]QPG73863.1 hypothetical protein FOA43_001178 [Brettanomyces nanus]
MKLLHQKLERDQSGRVSVIAEDKDDLWTLYNLIAKGDDITMKTYRNVKRGSGANESNSTRKLLTLTLRIEAVDFTPSEEVMRVKGRSIEQNEDVPQGSYHTDELGLGKKIILYKDEWDEVALDTISKACSIESKAEVGAVVLEEGVAHICLLTDSMTVIRSKIQKSIPKKRRGDSSQHDKAIDKFLQSTAESTIRNLNIEKFKAIVLVSPGTVARQLYDRIFEIATKEHNKSLIKCKNKFVVSHSSTGYLQGLEEALKSPELVKRLSDTKFQRNVLIFDEFTKYLNEDMGRAWYGEQEVVKASNIPGAIKVLLITDSLFKNDDIGRRKYFIQLTDKVKDGGAEVSVFSCLHDTGEQLNQLTGIAVILNYPIPNLDEDDE